MCQPYLESATALSDFNINTLLNVNYLNFNSKKPKIYLPIYDLIYIH